MGDQVCADDLILVYGTLQRGEYPYQHLGLERMLAFFAPASFSGKLYSMGEYPACVRGTDVVHGELFRIRDLAVADVLDRFERYDANNVAESLYIRVKVDLLSPVGEDGASLKAWTYLYNQALHDQPLIGGGHWLNYKGETANTSDFKGFFD